MRKYSFGSRNGFTLIEMLLVIAIVGLLSTLALFALSSARQKSRDSKRVTDIKQIQKALDIYYDENKVYPVESTPIVLGTGTATALCNDGFVDDCSGTTYMGLIPPAQEPGDGICNATDNQYDYLSSDGKTYSISFCIGGKVGDFGPGAKTADPAGIR